MRTGATGSKVEYIRGTIAIDAIALSMAEETRSPSIVDINRAYSDRRS